DSVGKVIVWLQSHVDITRPKNAAEILQRAIDAVKKRPSTLEADAAMAINENSIRLALAIENIMDSHGISSGEDMIAFLNKMKISDRGLVMRIGKRVLTPEFERKLVGDILNKWKEFASQDVEINLEEFQPKIWEGYWPYSAGHDIYFNKWIQ